MYSVGRLVKGSLIGGKVRNATLLCTILAVGSGTLGACGSSSGSAKASGSPIKIGAIFSSTGPISDLAEMNIDGLKLAEQQINQSGGIDGHPVQLFIEDDQTKPDQAVVLANQLLQQDGVSAVIGATTGNSTLAIEPVFEAAGVPLVAPVGTAQVTQPPRNETFRAMIADTVYNEATVNLLKQKFAGKRVAILHDNSAASIGYVAGLTKLFSSNGINLVGNEQFGSSDTDITPELTVLRSKNPDVIIDQGYSSSAFIALKNAKQLGMNNVAFIGAAGMPRQQTITVGGTATEGLIVPTPVIENSPRAYQKTFFDEYNKAYPNRSINPYPTLWDVITYDAMNLIKQAVINEHGKFTPQAIHDGLQAIKNFQGVTGVYSYGPGQRDGITSPNSLGWAQVQNGQFVAYKA